MEFKENMGVKESEKKSKEGESDKIVRLTRKSRTTCLKQQSF